MDPKQSNKSLQNLNDAMRLDPNDSLDDPESGCDPAAFLFFKIFVSRGKSCSEYAPAHAGPLFSTATLYCVWELIACLLIRLVPKLILLLCPSWCPIIKGSVCFAALVRLLMINNLLDSLFLSVLFFTLFTSHH